VPSAKGMRQHQAATDRTVAMACRVHWSTATDAVVATAGRDRPRDTAWALCLKPDKTARRDNFPPSRSGGLDVDGAPDGHLPEPKEVNLVEPDAAM
jgi:hypothetical protein